MIRTIPGYECYGIDENCTPMSNAHGTGWHPLKPSRKMFRLCKNGKQFAVTHQKFVFCAINQISPHFKSRGILVSKDGKLITFSERRKIAQQTIKAVDNSKQQIELFEREMKMILAANEFLKNNNSNALWEELYVHKNNFSEYLLLKFKKVPIDLIEDALYYSFDMLFKALCKGSVYTINGFICKTARGYILNVLKHSSKLKDLNVNFIALQNFLENEKSEKSNAV